MRWILAFAALTTAPALAQTDGCGADRACSLPGGEYRVALPEAGDAPLPVLLFLHGYAATSEAAMARRSLVEAFLRRGMAVVAPEGQGPDAGGPLDWGVSDGFDQPRDDVAFLRAVRDDAVARFGLDAGRVLVAGYSRGGSMAWDLACRAPDMALAFASQSGAFWEPLPAACKAPVHLFHMHGLTDRTVPLEGRKAVFGGHPFHQGNVMTGLDIWREVNGCWGAAEVRVTPARVTKDWDCEAGSLTLVLGEFGHGRQADWPETVADWFTGIMAR